MTANYKIPDEIKSQLTEDFYSAMWEALKRVFGDDKVVGCEPDHIPKVWYLTGTLGWHDAFDECAPKEAIDYFNRLDWSDGDMFDAEIGDELSKRFSRRTNADRIRAMTDEELAKFLNSLLDGCDFEGCPAYVGCHSQNTEMCVEHLEEWLKQEYKE